MQFADADAGAGIPLVSLVQEKMQTPTRPNSQIVEQKVAGQPEHQLQISQEQCGTQLPATHACEVFLMEMLAAMDQRMQQLRETQQGLVATVELACRQALGVSFARLVLVGSAALRVETPGSDIDVVCFTRRGEDVKSGLPVDALRKIYWALHTLVNQYPNGSQNLNMELIEDARVPILRVLWGPTDGSIAVDVSVDQHRPVDHVRWFQNVGAAPTPSAPPPMVAPLVTLTLRCVKWWLRQRQIPRTKEGGLPTIAWLLMAVHVCSLPETHQQALLNGTRPMAALLASLAAFFLNYTTQGGFDGVLVFAPHGSSSEFRRNKEKRRSPWAELSILDPTREGIESLDLAPRLPPATQLLFGYELRRASRRLQQASPHIVRDQENMADNKQEPLQSSDMRQRLEEVFKPLPEGDNSLPIAVAEGKHFAALFLWSDSDGSGIGNLELGLVERITPRPGWNAPFLHRFDNRSQLQVRLCDVEERGGKCVPRKKSTVILCPCHFICRVHAEREGGKGSWVLNAEGTDRVGAMRAYLSEMRTRQTATSSPVATTTCAAAPTASPLKEVSAKSNISPQKRQPSSVEADAKAAEVLKPVQSVASTTHIL